MILVTAQILMCQGSKANIRDAAKLAAAWGPGTRVITRTQKPNLLLAGDQSRRGRLVRQLFIGGCVDGLLGVGVHEHSPEN